MKANFFISFAFVLSIFLWPLPAWADVQTVIFLKQTSSKIQTQTEDRFALELQISLDNSKIQSINVDEKFAQFRLTRQIEYLRPLFKKHNATAIIWLTKEDDNTLFLHVAAVSEDRALVRMVESDTNHDSIPELAAAARQLLSTTSLFDISGSSEVHNDDCAQVHGDISVVAPSLSMQVGTHTTGGIIGNEGPSVWIGGLIGLELTIKNGFNFDISAIASGGPLGKSDHIDLSGWSLSPGLGTGYLWQVGKFIEIGPAVHFWARYWEASLKPDQAKNQHFSGWQFQVAADFELRWHFHSKLSLDFFGGLVTSINRDTYHRTSDEALAWATPFLGWEAGLSITAQLK